MCHYWRYYLKRDHSLFVAFKYQHKNICCIELVRKRQRSSNSTKVIDYLGKLSETKVSTDRKVITFGKWLSHDQHWLIEEIIEINISENILSFPPVNEWRQFLRDLTKILRFIFQTNITILLLLVIKNFIRSLKCMTTWIWRSALSCWITCLQMLIVPTQN